MPSSVAPEVIDVLLIIVEAAIAEDAVEAAAIAEDAIAPAPDVAVAMMAD